MWLFVLVFDKWVNCTHFLYRTKSSGRDDVSVCPSVKQHHCHQRRRAGIPSRREATPDEQRHVLSTSPLSLQLSVVGRDTLHQLHSSIRRWAGWIYHLWFLGLVPCGIVGLCHAISLSFFAFHRGFTGFAPFLYISFHSFSTVSHWVCAVSHNHIIHLYFSLFLFLYIISKGFWVWQYGLLIHITLFPFVF